MFDGLGLILVVTSYLDHLTVSATADHDTVADTDCLVADIAEEFAALEAAAAAESGLGKKVRTSRSRGAAKTGRVRSRRGGAKAKH